MKRAEIVKPNDPLVISEIPIPDPAANGVVIKIRYSGVCHSDVNQWTNERDYGDRVGRYTDNPQYKLPIVPGHEISGILHSLGETCCTELKIGDRVVVYPWLGCGECGYCNEDNTPLCEHRNNILGFGKSSGGYASHIAVGDAKFVIKLPDSVSLDFACMLPCSGLTTYNAVTNAKDTVERAMRYKGKSSILIVGAGGLGLWCIGMAKQVLPKTTRIVVADIKKSKLDVAKKYGPSETVLWDSASLKQDIVERTSEAGGFDAVLDFVNSKITAEIAQECLGIGGIHVMVGLYGGGANISLPKIPLRTQRIQGVLTGTVRQLKEVLKLCETGKIRAPPLTYYKLEDVMEAMTLVKNGEMTGRGIIKFE
ncbi:alcohol dehydrogenase-like [Ciona intestinalis]